MDVDVDGNELSKIKGARQHLDVVVLREQHAKLIIDAIKGYIKKLAVKVAVLRQQETRETSVEAPAPAAKRQRLSGTSTPEKINS